MAQEKQVNLSFEEALAELEGIVAQLERGNESLADGVALYERGVVLKTHCEALLRDAQMKVDQIESRDGKTVGTVAADKADKADKTTKASGASAENDSDSDDDVPF